jgi:hypothetical protein
MGYWLKLGEVDQALKELEKLPTRIWKYGWAGGWWFWKAGLNSQG